MSAWILWESVESNQKYCPTSNNGYKVLFFLAGMSKKDSGFEYQFNNLIE
jgi:hypothetical protein